MKKLLCFLGVSLIGFSNLAAANCCCYNKCECTQENHCGCKAKAKANPRCCESCASGEGCSCTGNGQ